MMITDDVAIAGRAESVTDAEVGPDGVDAADVYRAVEETRAVIDRVLRGLPPEFVGRLNVRLVVTPCWD